jgi:nucleotide-binding universal stress UspA family protein
LPTPPRPSPSSRGELHAKGVEAQLHDVEGMSAPRALHELAEAQDAGLLVIGSTRQGAMGRLLPGSTAERLMHGAPCPIAVLPREWKAGDGLRTIGVAYVDTEEGREALREAHTLARRADAALRVLTVAWVRFAAHAETEPRTAGVRGKDFDEVEGEHRRRPATCAASSAGHHVLRGCLERRARGRHQRPAAPCARGLHRHRPPHVAHPGRVVHERATSSVILRASIGKTCVRSRSRTIPRD